VLLDVVLDYSNNPCLDLDDTIAADAETTDPKRKETLEPVEEEEEEHEESSAEILNFLRWIFSIQRGLRSVSISKEIRKALVEFILCSPNFFAEFEINEDLKNGLLESIRGLQPELIPDLSNPRITGALDVDQKNRFRALFGSIERIVSEAEPSLIKPALKMDRFKAISEIVKEVLPETHSSHWNSMKTRPLFASKTQLLL
jgi:hypothetical protein